MGRNNRATESCSGAGVGVVVGNRRRVCRGETLAKAVVLEPAATAKRETVWGGKLKNRGSAGLGYGADGADAVKYIDACVSEHLVAATIAHRTGAGNGTLTQSSRGVRLLKPGLRGRALMRMERKKRCKAIVEGLSILVGLG